jgi:uncharacterized protein (TIGR03437 family)
MMVRLDSSGAIVQTTWLGTATFGSLVLTSNSGWSALGSLSQNPGTDSSNIVIQVLSVGPSPAAQTQTIGCMADLAQGTNSKVVPGLLVALTIENDAGAGPVTAQPDSNGLYPTSLAGFAVTFDGIPMPLFALNGTQLTGAVPFSVAGKSTSQMCIAANCAAIDVTAVAPSVFSTVVNQDGTLNSPNNPAPSGSIVTVYVLGLGPLSPAVPDGRIVSPPLSQLTTQIQIEFPTGVANEAGPFSPAPPPAIAVVTYAGPAPFEVAGVYQINVRVPAGVLESVTILVGPPAAPVASTYVHVSLSN